MVGHFHCVDPDGILSATRNYRPIKDGFVSLDTGNSHFGGSALESMDLWCPHFGTRFALLSCAKKNGMLKISVIDRRTERRLVLEGKLIAPWVAELRTAGKLGRRCRCRTCPYLNNIVEQDHRAIKRRVNASQGFRSFHGARRTIQGYEVVHMIRKGQVSWLPKGDVAGLVLFINETLGLKGE